MKYRLLLGSIVLLLASCSVSNDETEARSPFASHEISFVTTVESNSHTTVAARSAMETGFNTNDAIGVFMFVRTDASQVSTLSSVNGNLISNGEYQLASNNQWIATTKSYWRDEETVYDVVAYYPYASMTSSTDVGGYPIKIATDQSTLASLRSADFLYGTTNAVSYGNSSAGINVGMHHKLCKINFILDLGSSMELSSSAPVTLKNLVISGNISLASGVVTADKTTSSSILTAYYNAADKKAEFITMPQTIPASTDLMVLSYRDTTDSKYYRLTYKLGSALTLESGKQYDITIKYAESNSVISSIIVKDFAK
jgi:hypothetical protein